MDVKQKMAYHAREYRRLKSLLVGDAGAENFPAAIKTLKSRAKTAASAYESAVAAWNAARDKHERETTDIAKKCNELTTKIVSAKQSGTIDGATAAKLMRECLYISAGKV